MKEYTELGKSIARHRLGITESCKTPMSAASQESFRHAAVIMNKNTHNTISYGINRYPTTQKSRSIHAEEDALNKLRYRSRSLKIVNICVIRTTLSGKLANSKPCIHCLQRLDELAPRKGYRINWIYYSKADGTMDRCKLKTLLDAKDLHVSGFYRSKSY